MVFDEESGLFMLPSPIQCPEDQPLQIDDLGVKLPLASLEGRYSDETRLKLVESPRLEIVPLDIPQGDLDPHLDDFIPSSPSQDDCPNLEEYGSSLLPKYLENLIGNVWDDGSVEGRSSIGKSKKNIVIFFS